MISIGTPPEENVSNGIYRKFQTIGTESSDETMRTLIGLLLLEQSEQGLHCLSVHLDLLGALLHSNSKLLYFLEKTTVII